jgi:ElaA protein
MHWQWSPFDALSLTDLYAVMRLRQEVFVVEQDCAYLDADGEDPTCLHLLGWDGDTLIAYARVFPPGASTRPEAIIGRVVVQGARRKEGLGRAVMVEAHRRVAETWSHPPIWLSAQAHLEPWYGSLGYAVCGPGYDEDGIPHLPMRRPMGVSQEQG